MKLRMVDEGYPWRTVLRDGKKVGRVFVAADGKFVCMIGGKVQYEGAVSHEQAFHEGGARYLGHASAAALNAANAATRQRVADVRLRAQAVAQRMVSPDRDTRRAAYEEFFNMAAKGK